MGASIHSLNSKDLAFVIKSFQDHDTVMVKQKNIRLVVIHTRSSPEGVLKGYLTAVLDQSDRTIKPGLLDKFIAELLNSGWKFNVCDLDLLGYEYYVPKYFIFSA